MSEKVTVFGTGAWGSTMAQVLHDAGNDVQQDRVNDVCAHAAPETCVICH